jgi:hypothetical protein
VLLLAPSLKVMTQIVRKRNPQPRPSNASEDGRCSDVPFDHFLATPFPDGTTGFILTGRQDADCVIISAITALQLQVSAKEKLSLLKQLDRWRRWDSLDDRRLCLGCGQIITGHEINVIQSEEPATEEAHCPTEGCHSIPLDWILPSSLEQVEQS